MKNGCEHSKSNLGYNVMMKKAILVSVCLISVAGLGVWALDCLRARPDVKTEARNIPKNQPSGDAAPANQGPQNNPEPAASKPPSAADMPLTTKNLLDAKITPGDAKILLARCDNEIPDVSRRAALALSIISSLCKQGLVDEAWGLIKTDPGTVRTSEIAAFFCSNKTSSQAELGKLLQSLQDAEDRSYAIHGIITGRPELVNQFDSSVLPGGTQEERRMFGSAVGGMLKGDLSPDIKKGLIERSIQLVATGKLETSYLSYILDSAHPDDLNAQWESLREYRKFFDPKILESVHGGLAKKMVDADLSKAMDLLSTDQATKYSYPVLSSAVHEIYKTDPAGANAWMTNHLDHIDPATSQRIISCVAQVANQNLEFETSRKWANRILNAEVRQQLLDQVDKREAEKAGQLAK